MAFAAINTLCEAAGAGANFVRTKIALEAAGGAVGVAVKGLRVTVRRT